MGGEWVPYTPCDDAYHQVEHAPHSYTWADAQYECRGYPARVVISRRPEVGVLQLNRLVPPEEYQQKEAFRHRLMDWLMTLTPVECYILATAALLSASILLFTVVWVWIMF